MWKDAAYGKASFSVLFEFEGTWKNFAVVVELSAFDFHGHGFSSFFHQPRFVIKRIKMGDPAGHVAEDDTLGLCREIESRVALRFS